MAIPGGREIRFGPFRLDVEDERLWKGAEATRLRPKSFALLRYLLERPGRLVTKEELFAHVWPGVAVGDDVLTGCLRELRLALGDDPRRPIYLETVHRRGYRFIGAASSPTPDATPAPGLVGRRKELDRLHASLTAAARGQRQIVFVTGEAGIGKTALVDGFLEEAAGSLSLRIARGECLEQFGAGEPYLPVLAALGRICRSADGTSFIPLLRRHAPTWVAQLPALLDEREVPRRQAAGGTQARMLRELAEALEAITADRPLALVLDDLHWSDPATVDLLAYLGRRREPARLLLIGTYRPIELILHGHPLLTVTRDLSVHRQCEELALELLTEADVARYLAARPEEAARTPAELERLATLLHRRTDGHPLFMVTVVEALAGRDVDAAIATVAREVPESLRQMIEQQLDGLGSDEQALLETASAAGVEWSTAVVAAALDGALEDVDARCARLARRHRFLTARDLDEWPDGTVTARYAFVHALHQQVCYERLPMERAALVHRRIGARAEAGYGEAAGDHAAELAEHFERGRDAERAVRYRRRAAGNALQRWAYPEALDHLTRARAFLERLPETAERIRQELDLLTALGPALSAVHGQSAPAVGEAYAHARALCRRIGETPHLFAVLHGLRRFHTARDEHEMARELGEDLLRLAERQDDPALRLEAHFAIGVSLFMFGDAAAAGEHFERGAALTDGRVDPSQIARYGLDTGLLCLAYGGLVFWTLGSPDHARQWSRRALARAHEHPHPLSRVMTLVVMGTLTQFLREAGPTQEHAEAALALCREHGLTLWATVATILRGWAIAHLGRPDEGLALMREGLAAYHATGSLASITYQVALVIEGHLVAGRADEGLALLAKEEGDALRQRVAYWGELQRLKGELLLLPHREGGPRSRASRRASRAAEAEACFRVALDRTRARGAKVLELRAAVSLGRLWRSQGKARAARELVEPLHAWFTEGLETADLHAASALLHELGARA